MISPGVVALALVKLEEFIHEQHFKDSEVFQFLKCVEFGTYAADCEEDMTFILKSSNENYKFRVILAAVELRRSELFLSFDLDEERFILRTFAKLYRLCMKYHKDGVIEKV